LVAPAIVVPGTRNPPAPAQVLGQLSAFGCDPVLADDLETSSTPPASWEDALDAAAAAAHVRSLSYGTSSVLGQYDAGEPGWVASWLRTGTLSPVPTLPAGWLAWQFVDDVSINGTAYDVSVVDPGLFAGEDMQPDEREALFAIRASVDAQWDFEVQGTDTGHGSPGTVVSLLAQIPQIAAKLDALKQPPVDVVALAAALVADPTFVDAIAAAVVRLEAAKLSAQ
jgi:hypothetical protein